METGFTFNTKTIAIIVVVVMAAFFVYFWMKQNELNQEIQRLRAERDEAESNYLKLLENYMHKTQAIPEGAKEKLEELKNTYASIDKNIEAELVTSIELLEQGKEAIAVEKLTKVIENVLKERLTVKGIDKNEKKNTFFEMIKEAVKLNVICERLTGFINALRVVRNEEAHQLNVQLNQNETLLYVLTSIHILCELAGTKRTSTTN